MLQPTLGVVSEEMGDARRRLSPRESATSSSTKPKRNLAAGRWSRVPLEGQGLDFTESGCAAETADDHITGLWLISGDFADHSDRPQRLTAGIAGGWRVYEHAIAT